MNNTIFDSIKKQNEQGQEFWFARDLQNTLDYKSWSKFKVVIRKAIIACEQSGFDSENHFSHVGKMVVIGSNGHFGYFGRFDKLSDRYNGLRSLSLPKCTEPVEMPIRIRRQP